jgi:hypothetical protein
VDDNEVSRKQRKYKEQHPDSYNSYAEQEYTRPRTPRPKNRKPAIELPNAPQSYYDNAMPRKRQLRNKDEIKSGNANGSRAIYRKRGYDYWTGV